MPISLNMPANSQKQILGVCIRLPGCSRKGDAPQDAPNTALSWSTFEELLRGGGLWVMF